MTPLESLASAIATAEGFFAPGNPPPKRNHNPGDLRASPLARNKDAGSFVVFESDAEGIAALYHQLTLMILRGQTLRELISAWAPPSDGNDTANYLNETMRRTGLTADVPLMQLLSIEDLP